MYDEEEQRKDDEAKGLPWCCGQPMGWYLPIGFWRCYHRGHHRQNDAGESVDEQGNTEEDSKLYEIKMSNLYRNRY